MLLYALLFVSGESLVPVGYFMSGENCLEAGALSVFVENGEPTKNPFDYLCVRVELPLNK
jgi:hypothetical protein